MYCLTLSDPHLSFEGLGCARHTIINLQLDFASFFAWPESGVNVVNLE